MKIQNINSLINYSANTTKYEKCMRVVNVLIGVSSLYTLAYLAHKVITKRVLSKPYQYAFYISLIAIALVIRKIVQAILGYISYPAARKNRTKTLNALAKSTIPRLENQGFTVKEIIFTKSGCSYKGYAITHKDTENNGVWHIQARGNGTAIEEHLEKHANKNLEYKANTLLLNGFSTSMIAGQPTRYQLGAGFEAGLQYLEKEVKAKKIIMNGFSLGGGMMSEAIMQHDFARGLKSGIQYMMVSKRTFSKLSDTAAEFILKQVKPTFYLAGQLASKVIKPTFYLAGQELDSVAAAKKLIELGIPHIIVQSTEEDDGVIPKKTSIGKVLQDLDLKGPTHTLLQSKDIFHTGPLPDDVQNQLDQKIKSFIASAA